MFTRLRLVTISRALDEPPRGPPLETPDFRYGGSDESVPGRIQETQEDTQFPGG